MPPRARTPGHAGVSYHIAGLAPYFSYSTSFLPTLGSDVTGKPYVPTKGSNLEGGLKYQFTRVPLMLRVPGFTLFDAALDYTLERWRFAVNAKNIGYHRYVNGCSNQFFCAYGTPRTVIGTATFTF